MAGQQPGQPAAREPSPDARARGRAATSQLLGRPGAVQPGADPREAAGEASPSTRGPIRHGAAQTPGSEADPRVAVTPAPSDGAPSEPTAAGSGAPAPLAALSPQASPQASAAGGDAPLLQSGVGMQEMIESIRANVGLAARQGVSQARIALAPAELGEIRVHLTQSADGLIARVTADTAAAAQALAGARAELHHSLSTLGTSLLRLDIGSSKDPDGHPQHNAGDAPGSARRGASGDEAGIEIDQGVHAATASGPGGPALGELVDVLA